MSRGFGWALVGLFVTAVVVTAALFSEERKGSNCGGNTAAQTAVGCYVTMALVETDDAHGGRFDVKTVTAEQRRQMANLPGADWLHDAHLLVSTVPFTPRSGEPRRVVIVCDKPYTNVPRRRFFESPPMHAAGFSDGTSGLISPGEFAALNRSAFSAIDDLFPKEKPAPVKTTQAVRP